VSLFKYLPAQHLDAFLSGRMRFMPMCYYQGLETAAGDKREAIRAFTPPGGLVLNPESPAPSQTPNDSFIATVDAQKFYVFCLSRILSDHLYERFSADRCVEILDVSRFVTRMRAGVARRMPGEARSIPTSLRMHYGPVVYYDEALGPGPSYRIPEQVAMRKRISFDDEHEQRFIYAESGLFTFGRTDLFLQRGGPFTPASVAVQPPPEFVTIKDIGRVVVHKRG
jgi:hypothetical protein